MSPRFGDLQLVEDDELAGSAVECGLGVATDGYKNACCDGLGRQVCPPFARWPGRAAFDAHLRVYRSYVRAPDRGARVRASVPQSDRTCRGATVTRFLDESWYVTITRA